MDLQIKKLDKKLYELYNMRNFTSGNDTKIDGYFRYDWNSLRLLGGVSKMYEKKRQELKEKNEKMRKIAEKFNLTEEDMRLNRAIKGGNTEEAQNILKDRLKDYTGFQW